MSVSSSSAPAFSQTLAATLRSMVADLFGTYRPERHYMRGPGPKWRAKNIVHHVVVRPDRTMRPRLVRIRLRV